MADNNLRVDFTVREVDSAYNSTENMTFSEKYDFLCVCDSDYL